MHALVLDSREMMREIVGAVLGQSVPCLQVEKIGSIQDFIKWSMGPVECDLIVGTPSSLDDEQMAISLMRRLHPNARFVLFHDEELGALDPDRVTRLQTTDGPSALQAAVRRAVGIDGAMPTEVNVSVESHVGERGGWRPKHFQLSRRQRQIMTLVASGHGNMEIASRLELAEGTIKSHLHTIFRTLGVRSRTQAVIEYQRLNRSIAHVA